MTFLVAFARKDFALLASDTRSVRRETPDGPVVDFSDEGEKIVEYDTGWLASGPCKAWREAFLAGRDPVDFMRELEIEDPEFAGIVRDRQSTLIVEPGTRRMLDCEGCVRFPDAKPSTVLSLCPNGSLPAAMQRLLDNYQRMIAGCGLDLVLHATHALYRSAYEHCGPNGASGPKFHAAIVTTDGRREMFGSFNVLEPLELVA